MLINKRLNQGVLVCKPVGVYEHFMDGKCFYLF